MPSIYVQKVLHGQSYEKRIERVTVTEPETEGKAECSCPEK